mmetsp:Transcript_2795/g.8073  ORF Transcript_2795/g.8073 Transcript_2795/m.8073 type:complete len:379 (-) Transcript_2795:17-1153(-)
MAATAESMPREPAIAQAGAATPMAAGVAAASDPMAKLPKQTAASMRRAEDERSLYFFASTSSERAARGLFGIFPEERLCTSDMAARNPAGDVSRSSSVAARLLRRSSPPTACVNVGSLLTLLALGARSRFAGAFRLTRASRGLSPVASKCLASSAAPIVDMSMEDPLTSSAGSAAPGWFLSLRFCMRTSLRVAEFQRFLMALSVRPGMSLTIWAHFVPCSATASMISRSSSSVKFSFLTSGDRWLCHRSRHCLPTRPGRWRAIWDQAEGPWVWTMASSLASSSGVHACFLIAFCCGCSVGGMARRAECNTAGAGSAAPLPSLHGATCEGAVSGVASGMGISSSLCTCTCNLTSMEGECGLAGNIREKEGVGMGSARLL